MTFQFSSQGKLREFGKSTRNQGKLREFDSDPEGKGFRQFGVPWERFLISVLYSLRVIVGPTCTVYLLRRELCTSLCRAYVTWSWLAGGGGGGGHIGLQMAAIVPGARPEERHCGLRPPRPSPADYLYDSAAPGGHPQTYWYSHALADLDSARTGNERRALIGPASLGCSGRPTAHGPTSQLNPIYLFIYVHAYQRMGHLHVCRCYELIPADCV